MGVLAVPNLAVEVTRHIVDVFTLPIVHHFHVEMSDNGPTHKNIMEM